MKREAFPGIHRYIFELTLGINSTLTFSAGDLSTLIVDGLFALEEQDMLFPGITEPEDRLRMASMDAVGYERSGRWAPIGDAYRSLMAGPGDVPDAQFQLNTRLYEVSADLEAAILRQRMLIAMMRGLGDRCLHPATLTDTELVRGEKLIVAAEAITAAVDASAKPVL